jgi:general secretion pathway protein A
MYLTFFGLTEKPFAITPDPRYLYLSARHADALAHLVYGINEAGGFIQLTGEVGTGKTTTIRSLLARAPKNAEIALILNPRLSATEFLRSLCEELGLGVTDNAENNTKELVDLLNRHLLRTHAQGRRAVLIVDEAQNLAPQVLEQIRLLTNLETETQKLLQIILIGQPELRTLLGRDDLRQLAQRITGRYHLDPLSREETAAYVRHRLRVAGATAEIFTRAALREIYRVSGGVPRVINIVCDRALLGAYTLDVHQVPANLVRRAGGEVFGHELTPAWMPLLLGAVAIVLLAGSALAVRRYAPQIWPVRASAAVRTAAAPSGVAARIVADTSAKPASLPAPAPTQTSAPTDPPTPSLARAAPDAPMPLAALLTSQRAGTSTDGAFTALLKLWNAGYTPGKSDGCSQAVEQGLQCLMQRGSLAQLRLLNRPAILMLSDADGTAYQVVLRGIGEDSVKLQIGDRIATIGLGDLSRYWFGDFLLLWHPPGKDAGPLHAGMRGPPVSRLRRQLERWRGLPGGTGGADVYDADLVQLVEQFQHANRLAVDGIAGIETQVALDAALAAPGSPLLEARATAPRTTRGS